MRRANEFCLLVTDQHARVAGGELAGLQHPCTRGQFQQPHHVGEIAAALADHLGDLLLGVAEPSISSL